MNKQELIEELECIEVSTDSLDYLKGADYANERAISLAKQLDDPKKIVIPQLIAKFIQEHEDPIFEICTWADYYGSEGRTCEDSELSAVIHWYGKNSNEVYRAVVHGYEVEKGPLYHVLLPDKGATNTGYTFLNLAGAIDFTTCKEKVDMLTEQEIKAVDERYWPFAVKVDGE
ncbi:DUF1642 domain-containing protein [Enterococcus faecalis]|uniref:DUF1642 domain-containing protein n=1 Tax=Enterococcus faecalis TaxID=1351 RepID=UPI00177B6984|nr:DUF1642 domain-containing protein [Enterococcus faecalis]MBD9960622.1 DUF1642 domain-containing protein [Enterococcus faecalis]